MTEQLNIGIGIGHRNFFTWISEHRSFYPNWPSSKFYLPHLHLAPPLGVTLFEFSPDLWHQKTRLPWLSCGTVCVILHLAVSVEHRLVTDGQTDTRLWHIPH